jgi:hypothetical protein
MINIRFQRPVPSCATSRSSMGVLGSIGEPKIPGKITTPPSPAFRRSKRPLNLLVGGGIDVFLHHNHVLVAVLELYPS